MKSVMAKALVLVSVVALVSGCSSNNDDKNKKNGAGAIPTGKATGGDPKNPRGSIFTKTAWCQSGQLDDGQEAQERYKFDVPDRVTYVVFTVSNGVRTSIVLKATGTWGLNDGILATNLRTEDGREKNDNVRARLDETSYPKLIASTPEGELQYDPCE